MQSAQRIAPFAERLLHNKEWGTKLVVQFTLFNAPYWTCNRQFLFKPLLVIHILQLLSLFLALD